MELTHAEVLEWFKIFLNTTHTLACDMYITPFVAVMDYKFRFTANDTVVCLITGAMTTTAKAQDFVSYVDAYIHDSLEEICEILTIILQMNV